MKYIIGLAFTLFLVSSCASKGDPAPLGPSIVGTWKGVSTHAKIDYTTKGVYLDSDIIALFTPDSYILFTADGKVTDATTLINNNPNPRQGTYQLDGRSLNLKYTSYVPITAVVDELYSSRIEKRQFVVLL